MEDKEKAESQQPEEQAERVKSATFITSLYRAFMARERIRSARSDRIRDSSCFDAL